MKTFTAKEFASLAVIVAVAVVFALAVVLGAGTMAAAGNEFLLLALTLCGAVLSGLNGLGRRTVRAVNHEDRSSRGPQSGVALHIMRLVLHETLASFSKSTRHQH